MGMYTEFNIGVSLSDDVPQSVIDILRYMTGDINEIDSSVDEPCIYALLSPYPRKINDYSGYENAVFNGERY